MEKVLVDGSTVVFVARLLAGEDRPSAVNLFDLALLVESLILHDDVIVLSTASRGPVSELNAAVAMFGPSVRIEQREVGALLWEYIERNGYDPYGQTRTSYTPTPGEDVRFLLEGARSLWKAFVSRPAGGDAEASPTQELSQPESASDRYGARRDMQDDLFLDDVDAAYRKDLEDYAAILEDVYAHSEVNRAGRLERTARRMLGFSARTVNPADSLRTAADIRVAYRSLPAYENPDLWNRSPFQDSLNAERRLKGSFWEGVVLRAHLYLIASSLLGAPYKADSLRWPICWKFFGAGDLAQIAVDENYVRLAEDFERRRIESFNEFVGRPAVLARLPLFLRAVLAKSTTPSDIPEQALAIRDSRAAKRFREYIRELTTSAAEAELEPILRGIATLGAALSKNYGVDRNEVIWSVLSAGAKTAATGFGPASGVELANVAMKGAKGLAAWQGQRKFALISKPLHQQQQAKTFEHDVARLFGTSLSSWDLEVLDRLQAYGRSH